MRFVRTLVLLFIALAALGAAARAQTSDAPNVHWQSDPASPSSVQLVFENCMPDGQPDLPVVPGASFTFVGQSQNVNIVNFQMQRSVTLSYLVRARQNGPLQIPAFSVPTDKGTLRVPAYSAAASAINAAAVASARLIPERNRVWVGEVFKLDYELSTSRRNNPQVNQTFDWNPAPLVAEDWSKYEVNETVRGGEPKIEVLYHTRAYAKAPNTVKLEAANHLLHIQTGAIGFGFLSQPRMEPVSVTSDQPVIEVKALPPSPPGFNGAVGQFKLTSKVVPEKAAVGEPVTWTLELSGTGNWPDIAGLPARDVSNDFQVVLPKAKRTPAEGKLFDVTLTEDVVLVPSKAGNYTLGPIAFVYFDPKTGAYATATAPRTTLTITGPAAPQFAPPAAAPTNGNETSEPGTAATERGAPPPPAAPAPPAGIPRDPLPGADEVAAPLTTRALVLWSLVPFAALLALWAVLATRRAQRTDPLRPLREARSRLARTLAAVSAAPEAAERATLLLAWQRDSAALWRLPQAAPPASALPDAAWAQLWAEADRALYGPKPELPADWIARAQEALAAKRVPGFQPLRLFLAQNLFPFAALFVAAALTLATTTLLRAAEKSADPAAAYRRGDFAAAEKSWRERLAAAPTDWIAHHNLSLALAQQERPGESGGHAAAAFVQHPGVAATQWNLALAADRAGFTAAELTPFLAGGPRHSLARLASPAAWQRALIGATWLLAAGLGCLLGNAYGPRRPAWRWSGLAAALLALGLGGSAIAGVGSYGQLADARAVIVARSGTLRSIPTDADTAQKTTPLAAGSSAIVDQAFLDGRWLRLAFENGQTGWVRREDVVAIWK